MPIQILSPQLANQIAAGEVVERPASVVKELVENCLDADANTIDIEIEKGGHKRIYIRDNGKGIHHQELELALSRHATSKISKLDDLENICSLGFRGEALASISSVSRLTLTSKPASQQQAWQACAEGRDMQVTIQPSAHPDGTSIDVLDLFFNTPARRKFLRAEKTEFSHIDEVIRRIALSRFDVTINLKHNSKGVRKYPAIKDSQSQIKRIAAVCGHEFADKAIAINSEYEGIQLTGWLSPAGEGRGQNDLQYVYVNGRVMKDKLINHAIRQAYEGLIETNSHPAFVLFLTMDPMQVDVNVHPAKHEVRFHQARLVHDVIFRSVSKALSESFSEYAEDTAQVEQTRLQEVEPSHQYIRPLTTNVSPQSQQTPQAYSTTTGRESQREKAFNYTAPRPSKTGAQNYTHLMSTKKTEVGSQDGVSIVQINANRVLIRYADEFFYCNSVSLAAKKLQTERALNQSVMQPLLMPISLSFEQVKLKIDDLLLTTMRSCLIELAVVNQRLLLKQVPSGTRAMDWTSILLAFFDELAIDIAKQSSKTLENTLSDNRKREICDLFYFVLAKHQISRVEDQDSGLNYLSQWLHEQNNIEDVLNSCGTSVPLSSWLTQFDE
ncbi:DNA mismatch repair endonuclease MutL [Aliiglaciecola lipolytica]|uniref:DNA mismatch repair protein MutL n=1 Tax=Aliiglaciecola lipolytica E3 TaxID=1127673 RepID=K6XPN1_9ALTE|nr:DNA mismatch repair endonuclease MutL [Aliiglaciecola lipolytica]GAC13641.1 DNA mismatch repair protein MutL [Aliiglaciecola lipolytica E3]